jgi:hypothetical protein
VTQRGQIALVKGADNSTSRTVDSVDSSFSAGLAHPVSVTTLDDFIMTHPRPDLVKMDIEGAEVQALRGTRSLLKEHSRPVWLVETHNEWCRQEVLTILSQAYHELITIRESGLLKRHGHHVLAIPR